MSSSTVNVFIEMTISVVFVFLILLLSIITSIECSVFSSFYKYCCYIVVTSNFGMTSIMSMINSMNIMIVTNAIRTIMIIVSLSPEAPQAPPERSCSPG